MDGSTSAIGLPGHEHRHRRGDGGEDVLATGAGHARGPTLRHPGPNAAPRNLGTMGSAEQGPAGLPPSGAQHELAFGDQRATVVEVGGGIRECTVGSRQLLDPYPVEAMCDGAHGTPLIPWPNRLADGRYRFDEADHQVALTEPSKANAIHGLLRWRPWQVATKEPDRVVMRAEVFPLQGYPFHLDVQVAYQLSEEGLVVTTRAVNLGDRTCPYGCGHHPYLSAGSATLDECELQLGAATRIVTDPRRQLPIGTEAVIGTPFDFNARQRIGALQIDSAYADLERDEAGRARARLFRPDGTCAELWVGPGYPIIQIYTGDTLAPARRRLGLGTEPMSCPPNAFQTGEGVVRLEPGRSVTLQWGARLVG